MLLGVDRLDYTKGIRQRLRAFGELIVEGEISVEEAVFVQVASPSRERVDQYKEVRDDIERWVGRINGDLGRIGRPPDPAICTRHTPVRRWRRFTARPTSWW